ncbi:ALKBH3 [Mytilus edulis]|uniref:ALKBH3 n=1 Tax=Mytilus edulis TaxID=6550 RepID=A0A8S3TMS7_MYTED|nr:ALKBH3 [Mytilus edulis]
MNTDRKRRSRVQGGWAAPSNVRSDRNKPQVPQAPAWTGKNVDQVQHTEKKFMFQESEEEVREKPVEKVITKAGVCDLSTEPHLSIKHSDDERSLGPEPTIASLSFGDSRNFELRKKPSTGSDDYTYMQHAKIPLTHGSLLIMEGATQADWQHRIPREYHDRGPRINLTYRVIIPE